MRVLVDTSVWSLALRRRSSRGPEAEALLRLIQQGRAVLLGPIRQELLSGFSEPKQFEQLKKRLEPFEDIPLSTDHYVTAADCHNRCRHAGVQGSSVDFLICATAIAERLPIFSTDRDFIHYAKHLPIKLYRPED